MGVNCTSTFIRLLRKLLAAANRSLAGPARNSGKFFGGQNFWEQFGFIGGVLPTKIQVGTVIGWLCTLRKTVHFLRARCEIVAKRRSDLPSAAAENACVAAIP